MLIFARFAEVSCAGNFGGAIFVIGYAAGMASLRVRKWLVMHSWLYAKSVKPSRKAFFTRPKTRV